MVDFSLGPWPLGLDNLSPETSMPAGTLRQAHNVLILKSGEIEARKGKRRLLAASGMTGLWTSRETGLSFCVQGGVLQRVQVVDGELLLTPLGMVAGASVSFCDLNGAVIFSDGVNLWQTDGVNLKLLGLPKPVFTAAAGSSGGLDAGRYGVAVAFVTASGEEGPLSALRFVEVSANGKLVLNVTWPADSRITGARIYRTPWNGDLLYFASVVPVAVPDYGVGDGVLGRSVEMHTDVLPGGFLVRAFRGRLLVAKGKTVLWSLPMRYGVTEPRVNFVQFGSDVRILEAMEGASPGVYVGTGEGVFFAAGERPSEWRLVRRGAGIPVAGSSGLVPANEFDGGAAGNAGGEVSGLDALLPVWWSDQGLGIGLPSGQVLEPHAGQVKLPVPVSGCLGRVDRRLFFGG